MPGGPEHVSKVLLRVFDLMEANLNEQEGTSRRAGEEIEHEDDASVRVEEKTITAQSEAFQRKQ